MKTQSIALALLATLAIAQPALADEGLTRAQVYQQLVEAQQRGTEIIGDTVVFKAAPAGRAVSRAQVQQELAQAQKEGTVLVGDTAFPKAPTTYTLGKSKAEVRQELINAEKCGTEMLGDTPVQRTAGHCDSTTPVAAFKKTVMR